MKEATFILGYNLPHERELERQNLKDNRIVITNVQGVELQITVKDDGSFEVYLDDMNFLPSASNHALLVSKRYRG